MTGPGGGLGRRPQHPMGRIVRTFLFCLCLLALPGGGALAHAVLIEASPADGERVETAPTELRLHFSEPVLPVRIRLLDAKAAEIPQVAVEPRGDTIILRPSSPLPRGAYLLSYRVTSLDAHAVGATLRFGVGVAPAGSTADVGAPAWSAWAAAVARWLLYLTALGAVGLTLFAAAVRPPPPLVVRVTRHAGTLAVAGIAALLLRLGVAGLDLADLPAGALLSGRPWLLAGATSLGGASALAALGLAGIALGPRLPSWAPVVAAVLVGLSFALTGHAATAPPRWLTGPALGLHVLCAAFWLGSLLPLWWSLRLEPAQAAQVLHRFSVVALVAVAVLVAAGSALAWIQLGGDTGALTSTAYGWRLFGKLALVAGLLALAALNRLVLTPALADGRPDAVRRLRLTLAVDMVLGLAVLAVTATFPLSPPPRALATATAAATGGITVVASSPDGQAVLTLIPGRVGTNRLEAWITDRDGAPRLAHEASVAWAMPQAGIEPERRAASLPMPGVVAAPGIILPRAGAWAFRLDLLIDDFTKLTFEGELAVP